MEERKLLTMLNYDFFSSVIGNVVGRFFRHFIDDTDHKKSKKWIADSSFLNHQEQRSEAGA